MSLCPRRHDDRRRQRGLSGSGIYVLAGGGLTISGGSLSGAGVMIYNTGSDYTSNGVTDNKDLTSPNQPDPYNYYGVPVDSSTPAPTFSPITISNSPVITLSPITDKTNPFYGMVIYQRRANSQQIDVYGGASTTNVQGTIYAKWANVDFDKGGVNALGGQIIALSMTFEKSSNTLGFSAITSTSTLGLL